MTITEKYRTWLVEEIDKKDKLPSVMMGLPRQLSYHDHDDSLLKEEDGIHSMDYMGDLAHDLDKNSKPNLNADESKHVREYSGSSSANPNNQLRGEEEEKQKHTRSIAGAIRRHTLHRDVTAYFGLHSSPEKHRDPSTGELKFRNPVFTSVTIRPSVATHNMSGRSSRKDPAIKLKEHIENGDHEKAKELLKHHHIYFHQSSRKDAQHAHEHGEKFDLNNKSHIKTLKLMSDSQSGGQWREADHVVRAKLPKGSHGLWMRDHSRHPEEEKILLHPGAQFRVHKTEAVPGPVDPRVGYKPTLMVVHHATVVHDGVGGGFLSRLLPRK